VRVILKGSWTFAHPDKTSLNLPPQTFIPHTMVTLDKSSPDIYELLSVYHVTTRGLVAHPSPEDSIEKAGTRGRGWHVLDEVRGGAVVLTKHIQLLETLCLQHLKTSSI